MTPRIRWKHLAVLALFGLALVSGIVHADAQTDRRIVVGLKLFPTLLAADQELAEKCGPEESLPLLILYRENRANARRLAERLAAVGTVKGHAIDVRTEDIDKDRWRQSGAAGVFISEWLEDIDDVVAYGREHRAIVFSPFMGDVERGAAAGLWISNRILPYVNLSELRRARIRIKPFFLEVAKAYE